MAQHRYQFWVSRGSISTNMLGFCAMYFFKHCNHLKQPLKEIGETPASPRDLLPVQSFGLIFPCNKVLMVDSECLWMCFFCFGAFVDEVQSSILERDSGGSSRHCNYLYIYRYIYILYYFSMVEFRFAKHAQSRYSQSIRRNRPATLQNPF